MKEWYKEDLAFIHDVGFSDYALKSAPGLLDILAQNRIWGGLVVDLGCGSGLWARELAKAHYQVLGIDISESMIEIARTRVPNAEFRVESLFKADIPPCNVVTSIGECFNYLFDPDSDRKILLKLFHRIYSALTPGGVFIFDIAEPGQVEQGTLTRRIITFRKVGEYYRRDEEVHCQQLYQATVLAEELRQLGFQAEIMHSYGQYPLPKARAAIVARKPTTV